jgi:hypothetical protein
MRTKTWLWPVLSRIERDGGVIKAKGGALYAPAKVPAMWRRVAALAPLKDVEPWFLALTRYGPLTARSDRDEPTERRLWETAIGHLAEVASLWKETSEGSNLWEVPASTPIELEPGYRRLRTELRRIADDGVRFDVAGLELVPEPMTLDAFLWLAAAESARERHRFKRCERCASWFSIQRTDARFCSAVCRNKREGQEA